MPTRSLTGRGVRDARGSAARLGGQRRARIAAEQLLEQALRQLWLAHTLGGQGSLEQATLFAQGATLRMPRVAPRQRLWLAAHGLERNGFDGRRKRRVLGDGRADARVAAPTVTRIQGRQVAIVLNDDYAIGDLDAGLRAVASLRIHAYRKHGAVYDHACVGRFHGKVLSFMHVRHIADQKSLLELDLIDPSESGKR